MKRYLSLLSLIIIAASLFLHFQLFFDTKTLAYHLGICLLLISGFCFFVFLTGFIENRKARLILVHASAFILLLTFILFYISVIGSNLMWGKTITFAIFKDYVLSL